MVRPLFAQDRYGAYARRSALRRRRTVADAKSVLAGAAPRPGKCLSVGATPPAARPEAKAHARARTAPTVLPNARSPRKFPGTLGTSATGARSTLTPAR